MEIPVHVPPQVEDAVHHLLLGLKSSSTIVRWNAAKSIGRITERLPKLCAMDVLDAILFSFQEDQTPDAAVWHGDCLALAELARRGLLLADSLDAVCKFVRRAMFFDSKRVNSGAAAGGSHVRDASCYTCWSFGRAYAPEVLRPYLKTLMEGMVLTALLDREVNCRRAASAAFQECVGRIGGEHILHGIDILTAADYFSLGNRKNAYIHVVEVVAGFEEYRGVILSHLALEKSCHWDVEIRTLCSKSLGNLVKKYTLTNEIFDQLLVRCLDSELEVRHGAILCVAEIIYNAPKDSLEDHTKEIIANLVKDIEAKRLYRGRGGDIMRCAVCRLIECTASAQLPLKVIQQVRLLDSTDEGLRHPNEHIQLAASKALRAVTAYYFPVGCKGPSDRLHNRILVKYVQSVTNSDSPAITRGFALALGALPCKLLAPNSQVLNEVLDCLIDASRIDRKVGSEGDVETRRNAITSLMNVCQTVGIGPPSQTCSFPHVGLNKSQVQTIFHALLATMEDYNTDRRGDVGSWTRSVTLTALQSLTYLSVRASVSIPQRNSLNRSTQSPPPCSPIVPHISERLKYLEPDAANRVRHSLLVTRTPLHPHLISPTPPMYFDDTLCRKILGAILKQLSEKLDSLRAHAGRILQDLLESQDPVIPFVPRREILSHALGLLPFSSEDEADREMDWSVPSRTFPLVVKVMTIDAFFDDIVAGMVISVGGLTESVVTNSTAAMLDWVRSVRGFTGGMVKIEQLSNVLLKLFQKHSKDGRVILPLLKTLDKLLSHGCLDDLIIVPNSKFCISLLKHLNIEVKGCSDIPRLCASLSVLTGLLNTKDADLIRKEILPFVMKFLGHPYPKVRRFTAEQLYIQFIELNVAEEGEETCYFSTLLPDPSNLDGTAQLLLDVRWDDNFELTVRKERNRVADLLGVTLSERIRDGKKKSGRTGGGADGAPVTDEFESYGSLVKDAGR